MTSYLTSVLRTVVPMAWAAIVAWLLSNGWISTDLADTISTWSPALTAAAVAVVGAVWYAVWRKLEPKLPDWVRRLLLGAAQAPTYPHTG